jgi:hypothetical protein
MLNVLSTLRKTKMTLMPRKTTIGGEMLQVHEVINEDLTLIFIKVTE